MPCLVCRQSTRMDRASPTITIRLVDVRDGRGEYWNFSDLLSDVTYKISEIPSIVFLVLCVSCSEKAIALSAVSSRSPSTRSLSSSLPPFTPPLFTPILLLIPYIEN